MVLAPEMMIKKMIQTHSTLRFKNLALFSFPGTERERSSLSNPNPNPKRNEAHGPSTGNDDKQKIIK
jgi:hypothetical protein